MSSFTAYSKKLLRCTLFVSLLVLGAGQRTDVPSEVFLARAADLTLTEVFRIGDEAAGDTVLFGGDIEVAVDSRGQLYVTDRGIAGIRVFSNTGDLMRRIGRAGDGPGEFRGTPLVHVGSQDTVYTLDTEANRLTLFAPNNFSSVETIDISGTETVNAEIKTLRYAQSLVGVVKDGFLVRFEDEIIPLISEMDAPEHVVLKLLNRNGNVSLDTIVQMPKRDLIHARTGGQSVMTIKFPFARDVFIVLSPDNLLYYGRNDEIEIQVRSIDGNTNRSIHVPHDPVPVTEVERNIWLSTYPDAQHELRSVFPETRPAYEALILDDSERIWLRLSAPKGAVEVRWIVVNLEGRIQATTELPSTVWLKAIAGNRAFGTSSDEQGVPFVVAYEITP
ncbi:MAG: 6-bladed beta-propeller [Bacteroidetes bacterium]|nr:6-bladed beta-propeller [Bacteroidota bacterium]